MVLLATTSCRKKKKEIDPFKDGAAYPLLAISDENGNTIRDFEYVQNNLMRIYNLDNPKTTFVFRYNDKDQVDYMEVTNANELEKIRVTFTYDEKGYVEETRTSVAGIPIMRNVFTLSENKITHVNTYVDLFGQSVQGLTRVEYTGDNVSKVYTRMADEPEMLAFVGDSYDNKPQFSPKVYKIAALGFVGLDNNFFSFFSKNNLLSGKIYNEKGELDQKTKIVFDYDKDGLPKTSENTIEKDGKTMTRNLKYQFLRD
jgi:hypothetical protein